MYFVYKSKKLELLTLEITSFSKIHLNRNWIKDLSYIIKFSNITYLLIRITNLKKIILIYEKMFRSSISTVRYDNQFSSYLILRFVLKKLASNISRVMKEIHELTKVLKLVNSNVRVTRLPLKKSYISTLSSPHVFKKAQDQYEFRKHKIRLRLPYVFSDSDFIYNLINRTTKLKAKDKVTFTRKKIFTFSFPYTHI